MVGEKGRWRARRLRRVRLLVMVVVFGNWESRVDYWECMRIAMPLGSVGVGFFWRIDGFGGVEVWRRHWYDGPTKVVGGSAVLAGTWRAGGGACNDSSSDVGHNISTIIVLYPRHKI